MTIRGERSILASAEQYRCFNQRTTGGSVVLILRWPSTSIERAGVTVRATTSDARTERM